MSEIRTHRPAWVGWVPAGILSVILIGAGITSVVVIRQGLAEPPPPPDSTQVTGPELSLFTDEGLAYIERSRRIRFDLSDPPVRAADLGLPANGVVEIRPTETALDYTVSIFGGGAEPGGLSIRAGELSIETDDGEIVAVRAPLSMGFTVSEAISKVRADAETYGWDVSGLDTVVDELGDATRSGGSYAFSVGPGQAVGVAVTANAACEARGCAVQFDVTPRVG